MKAIKLAKLITFFVVLIMDLKLITKLPKCMHVFLLSLIELKPHLKSIDNYVPLIFPYFSHNICNSLIDQSYTFLIFFFTHSNCSDKLIFLLNSLNSSILAILKVFSKSITQNLNNHQFQATNTPNRYITSNLT